MPHATAQLLADHFDTAFAAPDGVKRLRELILALAMQGKLVAQDPNAPPARELRKEIEAEKRRLVKNGKIKGSREGAKTRSEIKPEEIPYQLPKGWEWVRLGDVADYNGRKNIDSDEIAPDIWLLDLEDIEKDTSKIIYRAKYSERQSKSTKSTFEKGDVLYGKLRPYLNKVVVADCDGVCTTEIIPIVPFVGINSDFLKWLLKRPAFLSHVNSLMYGVKMPRLGTEDAIQSVHPLPPLAEQQRIVAKIDQLMARCDELEKLRATRAQKRLDLHAAALKQLLDHAAAPAASPSPVGTGVSSAHVAAPLGASQFLFDNFAELYSVKENVSELRKAILQLAVMGKLVPQDPNDPPARELLKEIELTRRREVAKGKIKASKPLPPIKPEEIPYELPKGWEWVRFGSITSTRLGKMLDKSKNKGTLKPYLRNTNVQWHRFKLDDVKEMKFEDGELEEFKLLPGDLLICEGGEPGRCAIWQHAKSEIYFQKAIHRARGFAGVLPEYLQQCLTNDARSGALSNYFTGATIKHFPGDKLIRYVIPLPPLPEQRRIVAKIDQLMALCDTLDQQIAATTTQQTAILDAVMAGV